MLSDPQVKELLDKALAGNASGEELSSLAEALKQDDSFVLTDNRARLILADDSYIILDSIGNGKVSRQGQVEIAKQKDGQLLYSTAGNATSPVASGELLYNTIAIPRGGQYQLILADGTKVWLNAASSLRFPVAFAAGERRVQLDGEGYFEVAKDAGRPFIVQTKTADVQVLGTHFNVFAYADEAWKTTLFEGSVAVKLLSSQAILKPGNQAIVKAGANDITTIRDANTEEAIAWKEGYFHFNDADVVSIMNQLSRWYDVDIIYNGSVKSSLFTGKGRINLNIKLLGVVNALKEGGIKCKIDQNRLVVYP